MLPCSHWLLFLPLTVLSLLALLLTAFFLRSLLLSASFLLTALLVLSALFFLPLAVLSALLVLHTLCFLPLAFFQLPPLGGVLLCLLAVKPCGFLSVLFLFVHSVYVLLSICFFMPVLPPKDKGQKQNQHHY
jgi:hypothetical protein